MRIINTYGDHMSLQKAVKVSFNLDRLRGYILSNKYKIDVTFKWQSNFERYVGLGNILNRTFTTDDYKKRGFGDILILIDEGLIRLEWYADIDNQSIELHSFRPGQIKFDYDGYYDSEDDYDDESEWFKKLKQLMDHTSWLEMAKSEMIDYFNFIAH